MFELHIEFSTGSLVLNFTDRENLELVCHDLYKRNGFVSIYSEGQHHYVNTANVLYFYIEDVAPVKKYGDEEACF